MATNIENLKYRVTGMDCSTCAAKIGGAARSVSGVKDIRVSTATQVMNLLLSDPSAQAQVERAIKGLGYKLTPINETTGDDDNALPDPAHLTPGYRKALAIVVFLNLVYGLIEMGAGFFAGSQALKADSLDFLGDGIITMLGLVAITWGLVWRARSALIQGVFLGLLGLGVLANTVYRIFIEHTVEAGLMGTFALIALVVNVGAALVLLPHRTGDANVRAVWLFSRNDAIGNLAIVIAAGLVAWTGSSLPDLVIAVIIAGLFLSSSLTIIRDARKELAEK